MAVTPHGVLPRDSHEIPPTIGGVHNLMILLRDLVMEIMMFKGVIRILCHCPRMFLVGFPLNNRLKTNLNKGKVLVES